MVELKFVTINCRGLSDARKRRDVINYLRDKHYDILFLQDTHLTTNTSHYFNNLWKGKTYHSCYTNRSRGVAIMVNHTLHHELIDFQKTECGNCLIITCKIGTRTYLLANIYGPNEDNPNFYLSLRSCIESCHTDHIILAGDFNFVMDFNRDTLNYVREHNTRAKEVFKNFANDNNLCDLWRKLHPNEMQYTWSKRNPLKCGRLDMIFVDEMLAPSVTKIMIKPGYKTDHCMVEMHLQITEIDKGPGLWKFNESTLQDDEYAGLVQSTIVNTIIQYAIPVYNKDYLTDERNFPSIEFTITNSLFYETLIMMLRGETVKYCKRKARERRSKEYTLVSEIQIAQNNFNENKCERNSQLLSKAQEDLESHRKPYINGLIIRSRTQWHEEGEKSTKYFLSLEKRNIARKSIQYIKHNEQIISKANEILSIFTKALKDKYAEHNAQLNTEFVTNNIFKPLTEEERNKLETEITFEELTSSLQSMKKGRSPGSNGFTVDFFRHFWNKLGIFL